MGWIFLVMLSMIVASLILEKILPMRVKEAAGAAICWSLMAVTMAFLGLSTVGLIWVVGTRVVLPAIS